MGIFYNKPMLGAILITVLLQLMIIYQPFLNLVFKTQPFTYLELAITWAVSSIVFWAVEMKKWIKTFIK